MRMQYRYEGLYQPLSTAEIHVQNILFFEIGAHS